jgi:hypothetical protein
MTQLIVNIEDASLLSQIKKACLLLKGVSSVKVVKKETNDIAATKGYQEAMADVREGRVYKAENADEMFTQILGYVPR